MGIFGIVETEVFTQSTICKSFADVGLSPWNPDLIRELCLTHCPPPSELNETESLRELEKIMSDISSEQRALEDRIIAYGKRVSDGSSQNCGRY